MVRWDIGRALVLEGRWDDYLALERELAAEGRDRPMSRVRYMWWQGDLAGLREFKNWFEAGGTTALAPDAIRAMLSLFLDDDYANARSELRRLVDAEPINARRRAFIAQMGVEASAHAGDLDTAFEMLDVAVDAGLFDLHWLDKCALLAPLRADRRYAAPHDLVKARAEAILDALYGDRGVATQDTIAATS
jgi:serine/threonine-protein kinase